MVLKTRQTLRSMLIGTRPTRDAQDMRQCIYSIPCECDRCYVGETDIILHMDRRTYEKLETGPHGKIQVS
jgi:hypothetical protein